MNKRNKQKCWKIAWNNSLLVTDSLFLNFRNNQGKTKCVKAVQRLQLSQIVVLLPNEEVYFFAIEFTNDVPNISLQI